MNANFDVIVIGGGIVGLAHAWMAAKRGLRVQVIDRSPLAQGASVRNFGMIWPIGQPAGELLAIAMRSREHWLELNDAGVVTIEQCGSMHAAHRQDELAVIEEFSNLGHHKLHMLTADEVLRRAPIVNPQGLLGGMFSSSELRVNPRVASAQIAKYLEVRYSVSCHFNTMITEVDDHTAYASGNRHWSADRIIVCSGNDLQTLFPDVLQNSGLRLCKLQMLKASQPNAIRSMPHIASGLTLRHYTSFNACPTLPALKARIAAETPELDDFGIHVMASVFDDGDILLGDSHEYDGDISPFDKAEIDELLLRELRKVICLNDWTIRERWNGIYAKHLQFPVFECDVMPGIHVVVGAGGAGMTMAFGLAERAWKCWAGENCCI